MSNFEFVFSPLERLLDLTSTGAVLAMRPPILTTLAGFSVFGGIAVPALG